VAEGPPADPLLGDLGHRDGGHRPGRDAGVLQRFLERQRVDHGREHPHVVAGRPVEATPAGGHAPEDVAAADHDPNVHAKRVDGPDLGRDRADDVEVDPVLALAEQRLAAQLEQDALVPRSVFSSHPGESVAYSLTL